MKDESSKRFLEGAGTLGVKVDGSALTLVSNYLKLLQKWNSKINLVGTRDERGLIEHILDCMALLPHISESVERVLDVGSGAGLPGVVIAIFRPEAELVLLEPIHKKLAFLRAVRRELPLSRLTPLAVAIEDYLESRPHPPDVAVSRAAFALDEWLALGAKAVDDGGLVLGMEGSSQRDLPAGATRHPYPAPGARVRAIIVWKSERSSRG